MSPSGAGSKPERTGKRPLRPIASAALSGFQGRPVPDALPAAQRAPWPRSAPTAKVGCLLRFANSGAAVLAASLASFPGGRSGDNPPPANLFRLYPRKNPGRCDLLHISLVSPGLDRRHEQRDQNLIRRAGRPPHRLRPDRYRRRGGPGCAGLPPAGLNRAESAQRASFRARLDTSARRANRFTSSGVFRRKVTTASRPRPGSRKVRQARRMLGRAIIHHFNDRLIAASFCFRFGLRRRFIPAPHPPQKIAIARPWP
jgi:hypothetical protein